ncbi:hypothetical protein PoB_002725600 [Plakobranchus ocellatus]|uniref:Uncharacterized protein n=1 Tax=Plakobranchus ocellatus TaxID=259542 RepID=A0AAV4A211_9GAST|nr:hypothetical protein PoB_002725600 [Plakobranchus ocellatus]
MSSPMNCLSSVRKGAINFSLPCFVFFPHFLSCAIVPSASPSAVLYFFFFSCGVWDRIDPPYCTCHKRQLKQVAPLSCLSSVHGRHRLLSTLLCLLFPLYFLRYCSVCFSSCRPLPTVASGAGNNGEAHHQSLGALFAVRCDSYGGSGRPSHTNESVSLRELVAI